MLIYLESFDPTLSHQVVQYYVIKEDTWFNFDTTTSALIFRRAKEFYAQHDEDIDQLQQDLSWITESLHSFHGIPQPLITYQSDKKYFCLAGDEDPIRIRFITNSEVLPSWFYFKNSCWHCCGTELEIYLSLQWQFYRTHRLGGRHNMMTQKVHIFGSSQIRLDLRQITHRGIKTPIAHVSDIFNKSIRSYDSPVLKSREYAMMSHSILSYNALPFTTLDRSAIFSSGMDIFGKSMWIRPQNTLPEYSSVPALPPPLSNFQPLDDDELDYASNVPTMPFEEDNMPPLDLKKEVRKKEKKKKVAKNNKSSPSALSSPPLSQELSTALSDSISPTTTTTVTTTTASTPKKLRQRKGLSSKDAARAAKLLASDIATGIVGIETPSKSQKFNGEAPPSYFDFAPTHFTSSDDEVNPILLVVKSKNDKIPSDDVLTDVDLDTDDDNLFCTDSNYSQSSDDDEDWDEDNSYTASDESDNEIQSPTTTTIQAHFNTNTKHNNIQNENAVPSKLLSPSLPPLPSPTVPAFSGDDGDLDDHNNTHNNSPNYTSSLCHLNSSPSELLQRNLSIPSLPSTSTPISIHQSYSQSPPLLAKEPSLKPMVSCATPSPLLSSIHNAAAQSTLSNPPPFHSIEPLIQRQHSLPSSVINHCHNSNTQQLQMQPNSTSNLSHSNNQLDNLDNLDNLDTLHPPLNPSSVILQPNLNPQRSTNSTSSLPQLATLNNHSQSRELQLLNPSTYLQSQSITDLQAYITMLLLQQDAILLHVSKLQQNQALLQQDNQVLYNELHSLQQRKQ